MSAPDILHEGGFGLYVHWPFCQAKCPYCDFNSHVVERIDQGRWLEAYRREIGRVGALTEGRVLSSVFFGGGTPSLMASDTVQGVMDAIRATWPVANDWEVTLEANPTSVEAERFEGYRMAGVNRISLGVQALDDRDLRQLGRLHDVAQAEAAFGVARQVFERVSFDLIYARQDQTLGAWQEELARALDMAIDHLSLYQLTIEEGTAFGDRLARGRLGGLPDEALAADMYEMTLEMCGAAGFDAYEVSNFARSGAASRHNLIYWSAGDYLGIGPGAHGRIVLDGVRWATEAPASPALWLGAVESGSAEVEHREALSPADEVNEYLMMGLRTRQGLSATKLRSMNADPGLQDRLGEAMRDGLLEMAGDRIFATPYGRLVLNALLREIAI